MFISASSSGSYPLIESRQEDDDGGAAAVVVSYIPSLTSARSAADAQPIRAVAAE
ncbi:hypothetical protein [Paenarthrobacter sp. 4246]|uniref:hypothetical protein n=1 Tax=Paenarthrobacter sp. 4246 TaxID=3156456 RepID=UPI0033921F6D